MGSPSAQDLAAAAGGAAFHAAVAGAVAGHDGCRRWCSWGRRPCRTWTSWRWRRGRRCGLRPCRGSGSQGRRGPERPARGASRSGAMPCWGGVRSEYWKASPWSSWVAGVPVAGGDHEDPESSTALRFGREMADLRAVRTERGAAARVGCLRLAKRSSCWPERKRSCIQRKR